MERPRDKWVCHFDLLKKKGWHYEGQYDAKSDKFINIRHNEDNLQECDFEDVSEWAYVDFAMTKSLMKHTLQF